VVLHARGDVVVAAIGARDTDSRLIHTHWSAKPIWDTLQGIPHPVGVDASSVGGDQFIQAHVSSSRVGRPTLDVAEPNCPETRDRGWAPVYGSVTRGHIDSLERLQSPRSALDWHGHHHTSIVSPWCSIRLGSRHWSIAIGDLGANSKRNCEPQLHSLYICYTVYTHLAPFVWSTQQSTPSTRAIQMDTRVASASVSASLAAISSCASSSALRCCARDAS